MKTETAILINVTLALTLIGVLMLYSTPVTAGDKVVTDSTFAFPESKVMVMLLGVAGLMTMAMLDYHNLKKRGMLYLLVGTSLALLVTVLFFGVNVRGATRWLPILGQSFQPSEFAKLALIVILGSKAIAWISMDQDVKVLKDLGLAGISLFSVLIAIFVGTNLISKEMEKRTCLASLP